VRVVPWELLTQVKQDGDRMQYILLNPAVAIAETHRQIHP
jgi:hypothetical protein